MSGNHLVIYLLDGSENQNDINTSFIISTNQENTYAYMMTFKHFKTANNRKKRVNLMILILSELLNI